MIKNITSVKDEKRIRSNEIIAELADATITDKRRNQLILELEQLTQDVRLPLIQEILTDINALPELLKGKLISKRVESYDIEVDNRSKIDRYGWEVQVVKGVKMQFDPAKDEPVYEPIPKMVIERTRNVYEVQTNRDAISKIEGLLQEFLAKVRTDFKHKPIDEILEEKRLCELEISKIDRTVLTKSTMHEADFQDATYIKRPTDRYRNVGPDDELFKKFEAFQNAV